MDFLDDAEDMAHAERPCQWRQCPTSQDTMLGPKAPHPFATLHLKRCSPLGCLSRLAE